MLEKKFFKVGDFFHLHIKEVIRGRPSEEQKIILSLEVIVLSRFHYLFEEFVIDIKVFLSENYIDGVVVS